MNEQKNDQRRNEKTQGLPKNMNFRDHLILSKKITTHVPGHQYCVYVMNFKINCKITLLVYKNNFILFKYFKNL